jgi:hypothetical protein
MNTNRALPTHCHSKGVAAMDTYDDSVLKRFWSYVFKTEECWLWLGAKNQGYGVLSLRGKFIYAHRFSYEIQRGIIPEGLYVLHHCDVRACIRPDHLFLGTHLDNLRDMVAKKRHMSHARLEALPRGEDHWSRKYPERRARGERQGAARLTEKKVREILQRFQAANGQHGILTRLAREFGMSRYAITCIVTRKSWTHVHI